MKTHEYLVTLKNYDTLDIIDEFYIDAIDMNEARQIAGNLIYEYDNELYYEILVSVQPA